MPNVPCLQFSWCSVVQCTCRAAASDPSASTPAPGSAVERPSDANAERFGAVGTERTVIMSCHVMSGKYCTILYEYEL